MVAQAEAEAEAEADSRALAVLRVRTAAPSQTEVRIQTTSPLLLISALAVEPAGLTRPAALDPNRTRRGSAGYVTPF